MAETGTTSIDRALSIVEAFRVGGSQMTLQEIADQTNLNKATIIRLIASLEKFEYILKVDKGRYSLGPGFLELASIYQASFQLSEHAMPVLRGLSNETGQSAAYFIREGNQRMCLYKVESRTSALIPRLAVGDRRPILPSGTGKILMAFSADAKDRKPWSEVTEAYYAVSLGERTNEIASVAAPVFEYGQILAGALSVSGPTDDFRPVKIEHYLPPLLEGAAKLTSLLGGDANRLKSRLAAITGATPG